MSDILPSSGHNKLAWRRGCHDGPETREAVDLITSELLTQHEPGVFDPIRLLDNGDFYRHLADLKDFARAHRGLDGCYADRGAWNTGDP